MLDSGSTMEKIQLGIGILLILSVAFLILRAIYNNMRKISLTDEELKFDKIRSIYKQLKKGTTVDTGKVKKYAGNLEYRTLLFEALKK